MYGLDRGANTVQRELVRDEEASWIGNTTYKEYLCAEHTVRSHLAGIARKSENLRRDSYWLIEVSISHRHDAVASKCAEIDQDGEGALGQGDTDIVISSWGIDCEGKKFVVLLDGCRGP